MAQLARDKNLAIYYISFSPGIPEINAKNYYLLS